MINIPDNEEFRQSLLSLSQWFSTLLLPLALGVDQVLVFADCGPSPVADVEVGHEGSDKGAFLLAGNPSVIIVLIFVNSIKAASSGIVD